ncbi:hypothetical protein [Actinokineospora inagensis]|uniref:hypothetical protein n=1 Tax=Actinokineospora inagensis TaxID=103730 RepID=UPI00040BB885|nr:hypothetical protein [Actinokineospora inagensis]
MTSWISDDELLSELRGLLDRLDPTPRRVVDAAVVAGSMLGARWVEVELTEVKGVLATGARTVWRGDGLLVELGRRVTGLVDPKLDVTHVELHSHGAVEVLAVGSIGTFCAERPDGTIRLVLHRSGAAPLVTSWLR